MKTRTLFYVLISAVIFAAIILWAISRTQVSGSDKLFDATVNSDCAPWDGMAFVISIPYEAASVIEISIWQSPGLETVTSFSFPDRTGSVGNATYRSYSGDAQELSGKVSLQPFEAEMPVEGAFNFTSDRGGHLSGRFMASWGHQQALCG